MLNHGKTESVAQMVGEYLEEGPAPPDVKPILRTVLSPFCVKHRIRRLSLFGSHLHGKPGPKSDIDLLVEFEPDVRVGLQYFAIERELSELLGSKVDLNTAGFLSPDFREEVIRNAECLYDAS